MKKLTNEKISKAIIVTAAFAGMTSLAGCGAGEQNVDSAPPLVVNKTVIEKAPASKPKTIIVQPAPKPAPKTKTETNVTIDVKPSPKPAPAKPAPIPEPAVKKKSSPSTPAAKPTETPKSNTASAPAVDKPEKKTSETKPATSQRLKVRAEVISTSKVPDPKSVPYKNALVFTKYKVLEVEDGKYNQKEILVARWAMKDKKIQPGARVKVGEVQTLSLEPLAKRPDLDSVMRSDDTGEYDLEPYFAE